jgi:hypothetical protein
MVAHDTLTLKRGGDHPTRARGQRHCGIRTPRCASATASCGGFRNHPFVRCRFLLCNCSVSRNSDRENLLRLHRIPSRFSGYVVSFFARGGVFCVGDEALARWVLRMVVDLSSSLRFSRRGLSVPAFGEEGSDFI